MGRAQREWFLEAHFIQTALIQSQQQLEEAFLCISCLQVRPTLTSHLWAIHQLSGKIFFQMHRIHPCSDKTTQRHFAFSRFTAHMSSQLQCPIVRERMQDSHVKKKMYIYHRLSL